MFSYQEEEPEFVAEDEVDVSDLSDIEVRYHSLKSYKNRHFERWT